MDKEHVKRVVESLHFASSMQITCVCVRERGEDIFFKFQDRSSHIGDNYGLGNHRGESGRMMSCRSGESSILLKLVVNHNRFAHLCELWVVDEKLFAWLENAREWLQVCTLHPPPYNSSAYLRGKGFFFFMFSGLCGHTFLQELGTTLVGLYRILQCIKGCSSEHNLALNLHFFLVKYNKTIKKPRTLLEIKIPKFQCYGSGNAMHVSFFSQAFKKTSKKRGLFYLFFGKQLPIEVPIFNKHTYSIHAMQP